MLSKSLEALIELVGIRLKKIRRCGEGRNPVSSGRSTIFASIQIVTIIFKTQDSGSSPGRR